MRAAGASGLRRRDVIEQLRSEGWHVVPHMVQYALAHSGVEQPKKRGGWHCYTEHHVDALRRYLAYRSRLQEGRAGK